MSLPSKNSVNIRGDMLINNIDSYFIEYSYNDYYRLYKLVNGIRSSEYIDAIKQNGNYYAISYSKVSINNKKILGINYNYKETAAFKLIDCKHLITHIDEDLMYMVLDNQVVPVQYLGITYKNGSNTEFMDVLINLNTGGELPYEIAIIKET